MATRVWRNRSRRPAATAQGSPKQDAEAVKVRNRRPQRSGSGSRGIALPRQCPANPRPRPVQPFTARYPSKAIVGRRYHA
jgi:hypothetical protein